MLPTSHQAINNNGTFLKTARNFYGIAPPVIPTVVNVQEQRCHIQVCVMRAKLFSQRKELCSHPYST